MLEARAITFAYTPHADPVLHGIDLQVAADERVALSAPSGAGKTTLCRIVSGLLRPDGGTVLVDGDPLPKPTARGVRPVQLIGQHPELVVDPRRRMQATLDEAGPVSDELRDRLGIRDEWLTRFPHELSGGEMQRFCIARALAAQPRYLVADEISTMLDAVTQAQLWHFLMDACQQQGIGLLFVSHSPALQARIATRVVHLDAAGPLD